MTLSQDYQRPWPAYFDAVGSQGPRDTLLRAVDEYDRAFLKLIRQTPVAVDIACGEGRDTRELLRRGWRVHAFDASDVGIARLNTSAASFLHSQLQTRVLTFDAALAELNKPGGFIPSTVNLLNASFALPFCEPDIFPMFWRLICDRLVSGGLFCGQIFGDRDSWATIRPGSHYTRDRMLTLFTSFEFIHLEEVEKDGSDAMGGEKHHHVFHIVARKK